MWGLQSLQKAAAIGLSRMDEIANQSIASATQLLEKLDGEFDENEEEDVDNPDTGGEDDESVSNNEATNSNIISFAPTADNLVPNGANQSSNKKSSNVQNVDPLDDIDINDDEDEVHSTRPPHKLAPSKTIQQDDDEANINNNINNNNNNNNVEAEEATISTPQSIPISSSSPLANERSNISILPDSQQSTGIMAPAAATTINETNSQIIVVDLQSKLTQALEQLHTRDKEVGQLRETNKMIRDKGKKAVQARNEANAALQQHIKSSLEKEQQQQQALDHREDDGKEEENKLLLTQLKELTIKLAQQEQSFNDQLLKERKERSNSIQQELPVLENLQSQLQILMSDKMVLEEAYAQLQEGKDVCEQRVMDLTATAESLHVELIDNNMKNKNVKEILTAKDQQLAVLQDQFEQQTANMVILNTKLTEADDKSNQQMRERNEEVAAATAIIEQLKVENVALLQSVQRQDKLQQVYQLQQKLESVRTMQEEVKEDVRNQIAAFTQDFLATSHTLLETVVHNKRGGGVDSEGRGDDGSHSDITAAFTGVVVEEKKRSISAVNEDGNDVKNTASSVAAALNTHEVPTAAEEWELARLEASYNKLLEELQYIKQSQLQDQQVITFLEDSLQTKQQELTTLQSEYDDTLSQLKASATTTTALQQYQQADEEYQLKVSQLEQSLQSVTLSLETKQQELTTLRSEYDDTLSQLKASATTTTALQQYQQTNEEYQLKVSQLEQSLQSVTLSLETKQQELTTLQSEYDDALSQLKASATSAIALQQYQQTEGEYQLKVSQLEQSLQSVTLSLETKQQEFNQLSSEYDTVEDKLRQYQEFSALSTEHTERQLVETRAEIDTLNQMLQQIMNEKETLTQKVIQYQQFQSQVQQDKNDCEQRIDRLEQSLSERIIENASIRQEIKSHVEQILQLNLQLQEIDNDKAVLSSQLTQLFQQQDVKLIEANNQNTILLDEITFLKSTLTDQSAQLTAAHQKINEVTLLWGKDKQNTTNVNKVQETLAIVTQRATEAEIALSKVEDKKKRDLESLKKQNELIIQLQLEKRQIEENAKEYHSDLIHEVETLKSVIQDLQNTSESKINQGNAVNQHEINQLLQQIESLKHQVEDMANASNVNQMKISNNNGNDTLTSSALQEKDRIRSLSPSTSASDDTSSSTVASSSFVMIENESSSHHQSHQQQVNELLRKLSLTLAEVDLLTQRAVVAEESLLTYQKEKRNEIEGWQSKLQTAEALIKELQQERLRLERETMELEKAVSDSNYHNMFLGISYSSSGSAVDHRQRQRNDNKDVESGTGDDNGNNANDDDNNSLSSSAIHYEGWKKNEAGMLPILIQLWSCMRTRCPGLLVSLGCERPPRLGLLGQVAVVYVVLIHIVMSYEISKRRPAAVAVVQ